MQRPLEIERLRSLLVLELQRRGLSATPQALSALAETIACSDPEYVGDTDTLLAGLLLTGSYTVDLLEQAGVDRPYLQQLTLESVEGYERGLATNPVEAMFNEGLLQVLRGSDTIETSHILRAALSPRSGELGAFGPIRAIAALRSDSRPSSSLLGDLDDRVIELLLFIAGGYLTRGANPIGMMTQRRQPLTVAEDQELDRRLGPDYRDMTTEELEWIEAAFDEWFTRRRILTTPVSMCLDVVARTSHLLFGASHFMAAGGDLSVVDTGLAIAERVAPARDIPTMALFLRDDRVHVGYFTYRDSVVAHQDGRSSQLPVSGLRLYMPRPVPLVDAITLRSFENLVSDEHVSERQLQVFLVQHPEILTSLGYSTARPHLCLSGEDGSILVPDFVLELPGARGFDILDLKLPGVRITANQPHLRMAAELTKAIAQLRKYARFFENPRNRNAFYQRYGLEALVPEVIVVMGRGAELAERDDRIEIEGQLGRVRLLTYDDLLAYAYTRLINTPRLPQ